MSGNSLEINYVDTEHLFIRAMPLACCEIEREKFYPGPGIEPGPLALRASALPLCYPGQLPDPR